ncbi:MAG: site-specific integrase [Planctomycetia bacterium]|nr:site-specific integrase [Planctomycetia bacterium]
MATVTRNGKSDSYYIQLTIDGKRRKFYGFTDKNKARMVGRKLEDLKACVGLGILSPESRLWLDEIWKKNRELYQKLVEAGLAENRVECGTLEELLEIFTSDKTKKERTLQNRAVTGKMLLRFFDKKRKVDTFISTDGDAIYKHMKQTLALGTYQRRVKTVKGIMKHAVSLGWIPNNPFSHLKGGSKANRNRDFTVTAEMSNKILAACPNAYWRLIFAFARWGGLRITSELVYLKWSEVLWNQGKMKINIPKKTSREEEERGELETRWISLFPEIRHALEEYRQTTPPTSDRIFPNFTNDDPCGAILRTRITKIIRKAGFQPWPKLFVNLRATRDTELQRRYPLHVVCSWLGHSPTVSLKHYAQTPKTTSAMPPALTNSKKNLPQGNIRVT